MVGIAIISFVNYSRGQSRASMAAVMKYTSQDKKTRCDDERLVTGIGCTPRSAYSDFMNTKLLYGKDSGKMFYHMVQSFPVGENVPPKTAHEIAVKLAECFSGHEVLVCTHLDRDHIHSHFIINSVSFETGKKLHISTPDLEPIRKRSDTLCLENGLSVYKKPEQKKAVKSMSTAEYHTAAKGESWKFHLMNAIDDCMKYASSREDFISLMQSEGFEVKWTDTRKNITYTTPEGKKCCDDKLHSSKFLKASMQMEFDYRQHKTEIDAATGWEDERRVFDYGRQQPAPEEPPVYHKSREFTHEVLYHVGRLAQGMDHDDEFEILMELAALTMLSIVGVYLLLDALAETDHESINDDNLNAYLEDLRQEPENCFGYEPEHQGFSMTMM